MSALFHLMLAVQAAAMQQPAPYGAPPPAGTPERLAWDAELGGGPANLAIEEWLAAHPAAPASLRAMLYHRLCENYGVLTGGEARVVACAASVDLNGASEDASDLRVASAFRREPAISAAGSALVPLIANPLGSKSAEVVVNGIRLPWFIDTGAEISVVTDTTAEKLGVRIIDGFADSGTSTSNRVVGRLGMIDQITIGDATVRHLPVLVLPDAMLTITKDYTIPAILGLPAFAALGRIAWLDGGSRLALGGLAPTPSGAKVRVYWDEAGIGLPIATSRGIRGAQFDSGASSTALRKTGLALLTPAETAATTEREVATGGAGGIVQTRSKVVPRFGYAVAGAAIVSLKVTVEDGDESAARIGNDMVDQLQLLTIDFATMTLQAVAKP